MIALYVQKFDHYRLTTSAESVKKTTLEAPTRNNIYFY